MNEVVDDSPFQKGDLRQTVTRCLLYSVIVLAIMAVTLFFFSPRFVYWTFLDSKAGALGPEASRAQKILLQLEDPFAKIDDPSNVVIQWRLLFPLLGHYLRLPPKLYLSLPYLGCFLSLSLILVQARRATESLLEASLITALAASCSWFFVSTGWLGYFDSFYILGLLLITFYKPRWVLLLACLLLPWVNERFIFGLPLVMTLRAFHCGHLNRERYLTFVKDIVLSAMVLSLFLLPRLFVTQDNDSVSGILLNKFFFAQHLREVPQKVLHGSWFGLRFAWLGVLAFLVPFSRQVSRWSLAFTLCIILFTIYGAISIAGDISRSTSLLVPVIVLGAVQFASSPQISKSWRQRVLLGIVLLNWTLPTQHIIVSLDVPIKSFLEEWKTYKDPPLILSPEKNLTLGRNALEQGRFKTALESFTWAIKLKPNFAEAYFWRARLLELNNVNGELIERDYRRAIEHGEPDERVTREAQQALRRRTKSGNKK